MAWHEMAQAGVEFKLIETSRLSWIGVDWATTDDGDDNEDEGDRKSKSESKEKPEPEPARPGKEVRLLDYACGTGMISRALASYTTQCVGIDISENMVAAYNSRAQNQGLSHDEMYAMVGDLTAPQPSPETLLTDPRFFGFDLAVVGGGLHHFADPELAAARLVERLRPGGVLWIWDFLPHGPRHDHAAHHTVIHHGLSQERVHNIFEHAGAGTGFALEIIGTGAAPSHHDDDHAHGEDEDFKDAMRRQVFFARGQKAM
ncbi:hypothetical protein AAE478_008521 [Parahypoxylon ruwenzoriense]